MPNPARSSMHATATVSFRSTRSSARAPRRDASGPPSARKAVVESEALDQYLREISAYPLIDRATEAVLAQRIRAGDAEALETLVRSNLRFVVSVAKRYQNQGVSLADLIN